jgi:hypothetical protein
VCKHIEWDGKKFKQKKYYRPPVYPGLPDGMGCQMVYFQNKNINLCKFHRVLQWTILVYLMDIWSILRPFEIFYCHLVYVCCGHLVHFQPFLYVVPRKIWQPCVHLSYIFFFYMYQPKHGERLQTFKMTHSRPFHVPYFLVIERSSLAVQRASLNFTPGPQG